LAYSKKKVAIVIHHTDSNIKPWDDNFEEIRKIYKYHALVRWWWDIGYNYLIWTNWEIFEGRAGWDFVVWAHDKWNNQWTIWIALIWNYSLKEAPKKQLESLEKLIKFLIKKYKININKKQPFFSWCVWTSKKCLDKPLIISYNYPIIWHRDAWHTACPWDKLYHQLQVIKEKLWVWKNDKIQKRLELFKKSLIKIPEDKLLDILVKIEILLDKYKESYKNIEKREILTELKKSIFEIEKWKNISFNTKLENSFDLNNKIKVKLSYPFSDFISFKLPKNSSISLENKKDEKVLTITNWKVSNFDLKFNLKNNKLFIWNREIIDFSKTKFFRIRNSKNNIIEISSWDRKYSWDKSWKINDNKFRWDIILYTKNWNLVVVNELLVDDYLKGLWEVSNFTSAEKIKTIIILARTYARWYLTKARKFAMEFYDASDDPNIFQKYLWYSYEQRSPNVVKIVEDTRDLVVTYDWNLIKPWYFSNSNWRTISFVDYCKNAKWVPDCAHPEKFPFLLSVEDPAWVWKKQLWHWVGVPGSWVEYLSKRWWSFDMIIRYFLKWTKIEKSGE
jgi:hypothetical protein